MKIHAGIVGSEHWFHCVYKMTPRKPPTSKIRFGALTFGFSRETPILSALINQNFTVLPLLRKKMGKQKGESWGDWHDFCLEV